MTSKYKIDVLEKIAKGDVDGFATASKKARAAKLTTEEQILADGFRPFYIHEKSGLTDSRK